MSTGFGIIIVIQFVIVDLSHCQAYAVGGCEVIIRTDFRFDGSKHH